MRILVTGGNGQLGSCLKRASEASADEYIFTDVDDIDITDREAVMLGVSANNFDVIVNCAAYTAVDKAEEQEDIAERINALAVSYLAVAARDNDIPLIHISTDYVFGGDMANTPRKEDEEVSPLGTYGRTKLHGEEAIRESGCRHIIIRTAWLYSEYGKNFVKTMLGLTASKPELNVVYDQTGTPTYAGDLAEAIVEIISRRLYRHNSGTYHYTNEGVCSWFDVAVMTAKMAGNDRCTINPCRTDEYPTAASRPAYSVLDKSKFKRTFGMKIPYWTDSLLKCISNIRMI